MIRATTLASAVNDLIRAAEAALKASGRAERIVFLVDGTDKMRGEDKQQFFVQDAEQLLAIQALAIYTAPLQLKYDGRLGGKLDADLVLPMMKLQDQDGARWDAGWDTLQALLLRRVDRSVFEAGAAGDAQIARLVEHCGGHPRELLRLLRLCCEFADTQIDAPSVTRAIQQLAADYTLLYQLDPLSAHGGNDERAQELLHRLALMEYNDGSWRRSHPVERALDGYKIAAAS